MTAHDQTIVDRAGRAKPVGSPLSFVGQQRRALRRKGLYRNGVKRGLDVTLVLLAAPVALPLILGFALALFLLEGAAPFYRQDRVGRDGRIYKMWKLRSMVPDAEARLAVHLAADPAAWAEWNSTQKLKADPRVTPLGRLLRKSSMDELPQLWNVLRGDMSVVGPRPVVRLELDRYYAAAREHYLSVPPGLTGLWQVSGRNDIDYDERVQLDRHYVDNWNVWTDMTIVLRTVGVMFGRKGAY